MKIILTAKTDKKNPSSKDIDKTVDVVLEVGGLLHQKHNFKEVRCRLKANGTSLIMKDDM